MRLLVILLNVFLLIACTAEVNSQAEPVVSAAWIRNAPPSAGLLAGYMTLHNPTATEIKVVAASSESFERIEFHHMRMTDGQMVMRQLPHLPAPAQGKAVMTPGSDHLMLIGPRASMKAGDRVLLELMIEPLGAAPYRLPVEFLVRDRAPQQ